MAPWRLGSENMRKILAYSWALLKILVGQRGMMGIYSCYSVDVVIVVGGGGGSFVTYVNNTPLIIAGGGGGSGGSRCSDVQYVMWFQVNLMVIRDS
jgi:hypothetical protein